ncbi:IS5-like element ISSod12 family transposase [soil metagenome]
MRRGEILFSYDSLDTWGFELERSNKNKKGEPFTFPNSFIQAIGYIRCSFHLPYRQTEGIINATGKSIPDKSPSFGHISKRINKLNIDIKRRNKTDEDDLIIAVDITGIKVTNRGQWKAQEWNVQNKKGYLKIHVAVNIKTKEILALEVTDEKVNDGRMLKKLINHVLAGCTTKTRGPNKMVIKIKSALGDGAYDSNANFRYLQEKGITPGIKIRKNPIVSPKNNRLRNQEVIQQTKKDLLKWKKKRKPGHRWIAETAFSTIKRTFGEYVSATKFNNMIKEMMIIVSLYNLFRRL